MKNTETTNELIAFNLAKDVIDHCLKQPLSYWKIVQSSLSNFLFSVKDIAHPWFNDVITVEIECNQTP